MKTIIFNNLVKKSKGSSSNQFQIDQRHKLQIMTSINGLFKGKWIMSIIIILLISLVI